MDGKQLKKLVMRAKKAHNKLMITVTAVKVTVNYRDGYVSLITGTSGAWYYNKMQIPPADKDPIVFSTEIRELLQSIPDEEFDMEVKRNQLLIGTRKYRGSFSIILADENDYWKDLSEEIETRLNNPPENVQRFTFPKINRQLYPISSNLEQPVYFIDGYLVVEQIPDIHIRFLVDPDATIRKSFFNGAFSLFANTPFTIESVDDNIYAFGEVIPDCPEVCKVNTYFDLNEGVVNRFQKLLNVEEKMVLDIPKDELLEGVQTIITKLEKTRTSVVPVRIEWDTEHPDIILYSKSEMGEITYRIQLPYMPKHNVNVIINGKELKQALTASSLESVVKFGLTKLSGNITVPEVTHEAEQLTITLGTYGEGVFNV